LPAVEIDGEIAWPSSRFPQDGPATCEATSVDRFELQAGQPSPPPPFGPKEIL
jgi:hypothetical protein